MAILHYKVLKTAVLVFSLFLLFSLAGCATGVDRVKLHDPLTFTADSSGSAEAKPAQTPSPMPDASKLTANLPEAQKIKIAINKIKDARPDISCIGAKKNTYGMKMGKVDVEEGIIFVDKFKSDFVNALRVSGYDPISLSGIPVVNTAAANGVKAFVDADIRTFWVEFMPGFFVVDAESDVIFDVRIKDPATNREIWEDTFRGKGKVSSGLAVTHSMYEESINIAYADAMRKFQKAISNPQLMNLLTPQEPVKEALRQQ